MDESTDQRAALRIPIAYRIKVVTEDEIVAFTEATNISLGGLFLVAPPLLPVGSRCGVVIFLMDNELGKRVVVQGTVVRSDARGTAIRFLNGPEDESLDALITLVESLGPEAPESLNIPS